MIEELFCFSLVGWILGELSFKVFLSITDKISDDFEKRF
jgi:hypothetical protein